MIVVRPGVTNLFFIPGTDRGLLVDAGGAETLNELSRALKAEGIRMRDVGFVLASHYHPDHAGLIGELTAQGVRLLLPDPQKEFIRVPDRFAARENRAVHPVDPDSAIRFSCADSRAVLRKIGISGEIVPTPSHSPDSVSLILDRGDCIAGDLEPPGHLDAYGETSPLREDWERILAFRPKTVYFSHRPPADVSGGLKS